MRSSCASDILGQMCNLEGNLIAVDIGLTLAVGPQVGEVRLKLAGDSTVMVQNVGRLLIVTDIEGAYDRPADAAIDWLGSWNDLIGMASVMEATLSDTQIYHPDYVPPPPPPPPGQNSGADGDSCPNPPPGYSTCRVNCIADHNQWIFDELNDWLDAIQNLADVIDNENQIYNDKVVAAVLGREACESSAITLGGGGTGLAVAAAIVTFAAGGPLGILGGIIGGGSAVIGGVATSSVYSRCSTDFRSIVETADDIRDLRIAGAELLVDVTEEQYEFALAAENTCLAQCCSASVP